MRRLAPIVALAALIGAGGCAAGVGYGSYGGTYYSSTYPVPVYPYGYANPYPYGAIGLGGVWIGGGHRDWHHWHALHGHRPWGAWHGGPHRVPGAWAGRGHWSGHHWHH
ncbi:MAG TPA: hypothetical protein VH855_22365 [Acetobacteraceae bacterium]